jgi:hypothetical protein
MRTSELENKNIEEDTGAASVAVVAMPLFGTKTAIRRAVDPNGFIFGKGKKKKKVEEKVDSSTSAAMPSMMDIGDNSSDLNKWSKSVAGHDGKKQTAPKGNSLNSDTFKDHGYVVGYTDVERKMASKAIGKKTKHMTSPGSKEPKGTNTTSPLSGVRESIWDLSRYKQQRKGVIYKYNPKNPLDQSEILGPDDQVIYDFKELRNKALHDALLLVQDLKTGQANNFRKGSDTAKKLNNILTTIVAAYDEIDQMRGAKRESTTNIKEVDMKKTAEKPKVAHCSQCGKGFSAAGLKPPHHTGFSHCKDHKGMKIVAEGKKAERMIKHVEKSEEDSGKSKAVAKKIAYATANKRGMLDNKNKKKTVKEAHMVTMHVEDDHEVSMAQGDLYSMAKKAIALHGMLDNVDNLEGWVQAKITMASDYIGTVFDHIDQKMAMQGTSEPLMGEAAIVPTGSTTSRQKLPPQTRQMVQKVSQGMDKNKNSVMTDKDGNVSVVDKKDTGKMTAAGMMTVDEASLAAELEEGRWEDAGRIVGSELGSAGGKALGDRVGAGVAGGIAGHAVGGAAGGYLGSKLDKYLGEDEEYQAALPAMVKDLEAKKMGPGDMRRSYGSHWKKLSDAAKEKHGPKHSRQHLVDLANEHMGMKESAGDDTVDNENIIYQMRKVINLRGQYEVKFPDGSREMVSPRVAHAVIQKYMDLRLPQDKLAFVRSAGKNMQSLQASIGMKGIGEEAGDRVRRIFGEDWGSSDTSAAIDAMKEYIRNEEGGRYTPETIEAAAAAVADRFYDQMGHDRPEAAADSLVSHFVRRWMSGSLKVS